MPAGVGRHSIRSLVLFLLVFQLYPQTAFAQSGDNSRWQIDFTGGASGGSLSSTNAPVGDGPSFKAPGSFAQLDRSVTSWFLSPSSLFLMPTIQSLAKIVASPGSDGRTSSALAVRVTRRISKQVGLEIGISYASGSPSTLSGATLAAVEQSSATFTAAFSSLFASTPAAYLNPQVDASALVSKASGGEFQVTAALAWTPTTGRFQPYLILGGGERTTIGANESVNLRGTYSFASNRIPIAETDSVLMTYAVGHSLGPVLGGGIRQFFTQRTGLTVDARASLGHQSDQLRLTVTPSSQTGAPSGFVVQNPPQSNGTIVFSNTSSQQGTLSGPPIVGLTTAAGTGWRWDWTVTTGWFWRF